MAYVCLDCSHRANAKFPGGKCPACDSFNIEADSKTPSASDQLKEPKTAMEYFILVVFWGVLLWGIWDRYLK